MAYGPVNVPGHSEESATTSVPGLMSAADKAKLDSLGKTLTLTGAATGTYNGQTDETFLIPDRKGCRFVVGTSTNGWTEKDCDYLCDGTADQVEIQAAINALPSTGGEIVILDGTYNLSSDVRFTTSHSKYIILAGIDKGTTILKRQYDGTTDNGMISFGSSYNPVTIRNLCLDGNKENYSYSRNHGIFMSNNGGNTSIEILDCKIQNMGGWGARVEPGGRMCIVKNNYFLNLAIGVTTANGTIIENNVFESCGTGASISNGSIAIGNNFHLNGTGLSCSYLSVVVGNHFNRNSVCGISCTGYPLSAETLGSLVCGNVVIVDSADTSTLSISVKGYNSLICSNLLYGKNYTNGGTNNTFDNNKYN